MSTVELLSKVRDYHRLQFMRDEAEAEMKCIQDAIKDELTTRNTDEMVVGDYKIRWKLVNSTRFDSTSFKRDNPGLYEHYIKPARFRRFSIV